MCLIELGTFEMFNRLFLIQEVATKNLTKIAKHNQPLISAHLHKPVGGGGGYFK